MATFDPLRTLARCSNVERVSGKIELKDVLNVAGSFLVTYGFFAGVCFFILVDVWAHGAPTSPDAGRGYVYSHDEHGWVTYFSAFQATSCALLLLTSVPLVFIGIFVGPKRNVIHRRGWLSIGATWDPDDPKRLRRFGFLCGAVSAPIIVFIFGPLLVRALNSAGVIWSLG